MKHHAPNLLFRDMLLNILLIFVATTLILLPWISENQKSEEVAPGTMSVEIVWDPASANDIDLWGKAPGDVSVGFRNTGGRVFNLLRDDLGQDNDPLRINYENMYSRGLPDGTYVINLHYYNGRGPERVVTKVTVNAASGKRTFFKEVVLERRGQEVTVMRLHIVNGQIVGMDEIPVHITPFVGP